MLQLLLVQFKALTCLSNFLFHPFVLQASDTNELDDMTIYEVKDSGQTSKQQNKCHG